MIDFDDAPGSSSSSPSPGGPRGRFGWSAGAGTRPASAQPRELAPGETLPYIESLNAPQREAALATEGPLMVLAGAGSGKTKMLTSRIAYLMDVRAVPAWQILAVTFTNKAAREMQERVQKHLAGSAGFLGAPEIGTFHSVCIRILRRELQATPFTKPFTIYDDSDQLSLIKGVLEKLSIDDKAFSAKGMQGAINRLKCDAIEPHEVEPETHNLFERKLKEVYTQYQKDLFANNALDFGEILCMTYRILRDVPELRSKYQHRYRYIHVDEYQDTNRAQYLLLSMLAKKEFGGHENICVVGDEDQSIYGWRGADIRNILEFETDYPSAHTVKLEQNYRSTKTIIDAAAHVIANNSERKDKTLWTDNLKGGPITRAFFADERGEAEHVIREIKRIAENEGLAYRDFAILYRTHAQSRQFEQEFRLHKVPYEIVGGLRYFDRKEVKDILSYFKVLQNPQDSIGLKRIINVPARGIGKTTIDKIEQLQFQMEQDRARAAAGVPPSEDAVSLPGFEGAPTDISFHGALRMCAQDPKRTSAATAKKLAAFVQLLDKLAEAQPRLLLSELYHMVLDETGYVNELRQEGTDEAMGRIENLEEFDTLLQEFQEAHLEGLSDEDLAKKKPELLPIFLEESALATDVTGPKGAGGQPEHDGNIVSMMTLHGSKGLEFQIVFLVGMEEGLFPSVNKRDEGDTDQIQEERRLCYVGMTRAKEQLFMTHVNVRRIWGEINYQDPARFFEEIPEELVEYKDMSNVAGARQGSSRHFGNAGYGDGSGKTNWDDEVSQVPRAGAAWPPGPPSSGGGMPTFGDSKRAASVKSKVGTRIRHPDYGSGRVISQEGAGKDEKVTVQFDKGGPRKFLARFIEGFFE